MDDWGDDDGWGEDLDALIDDDDVGTGAPMPAPVPAPVPVPAPAPAPLPTGDEGWGDELDDLDDLDEEPAKMTQSPIQSNSAQEEGWGDDEDDLFQDSLEIEAPDEILQTPSRQPNHRLEEVNQELVSYVESLMVLLPSINAVLEAEYNLPEKAAELLHYYNERPQLREYTIEKELPRMDYQVVLQHESGEEPIVVDNKSEIAQLFKLQNELDLLVRCANQSLLADLLQVMTRPDGLVRPQYMATLLAESCMFVLRCRPNVAGGLVECTSRLVLSLPEPSGQRYPVANLKVHILLGVPTSPQQPALIEYKLQAMDIVIPSMDVLRPTAQFLMESGLLDHPPMSPFPESPAGTIDDNDAFRDVFLQQSQTMLQNSSVGLKSAWNQIDSVAGLQSKMNMVKNILPSTDSSMLEAAMAEQEAFQRQLQSQARQQQQPLPRDHVPVSYPPSHSNPMPPQARPTSILGSFMGAIAKSVALPEEDPSIYEHYATGLQQTNSGGSQPQTEATFPRPKPEGAFPRPEAAFPLPHAADPASAAPMQLYHKEEALAPAPVQESSPWLSQMTQPNPPPPVTAPVPAPPPQAKPPIVESTNDDGSGDDGLDLGLDDGWGDEDFTLDDEPREKSKDAKVAPVEHPALAQALTATQGVSQPKIVPTSKVTQKDPEMYSIEDDIVETRKRWVNPRPGPRYLRQMLS